MNQTITNTKENKMNQEIAVVNGTEIRVIREGENLLFVAKDIVEGVGAAWKGNAGSLEHIPSDFRGVRSVQTPSGTQEMAMLTEAGLNMYLFRSDKPAALPFQRKLAEEVLPSIRKHGMYATPATAEAILNDPDVMIKVLTALKEERIAKVSAQLEAKEAQKALAIESAAKQQVAAEKEVVVAEKEVVEKKLNTLGSAVRSLYTAPSGTTTVRDAAKFFASRGWNVSEGTLRKTLQEIGWLTKGKGATATASAISTGYMAAGVIVTNHLTGWSGEVKTPKITGKGFTKITVSLKDWGYSQFADDDDDCTLSMGF